MAHRTLSKPRRAPAGRGPGAEHRWEYRFAPAEDLHAFCLDAVGVDRAEVWAVGVDYFRFCLRNGNTILTGVDPDRLRGCYAFTLPVEPEEFSAVEARLGYLRDGEYRRTFRTVTLPLELLEQRREGECTILRPVWRAYLDGNAPTPEPLTPEGEATPCENCYSDGLF